MRLKLKYEDRTLYESMLSELPDSLVIGRRPGCEWIVPQELSLVSGRHAEILKRNDRLFIRDLDSRNGIILQGERIRERELTIGDSLEVGSCTLQVKGAAVTDEVPPEAGESPPAQLVGQSGDLKGRTYPIGSDLFTIGADPDSSLQIGNPMVSQHHAEIRSRGGEFWIRDLGSTNETLVNGRKLEQDEDVMLRAGDRIYVAHYALAFDDGSGVLRAERKRWVTWGAAATVAVLLLALCARTLMPGTDRLLAKARRLASDGQFDKALVLLDKADQATGDDENKEGAARLAEQVKSWKQTHATWTAAVSSLETGDWRKAAGALNELRTRDEAAWAWNDEARRLSEQALLISRLLEAFIPSRRILDKGYMARQIIKGRHETLIAAIAPLSDSPPPYLADLLAEAGQVKQGLSELLLKSRRFDVLDGLREWPFDTAPIMADLERARERANGEAKQNVGSLIEAVKALGLALKQYRALADDMQAMRFSRVAAAAIGLPGEELCARDPRIEQARNMLDVRCRGMADAAKHLSVSTNGLQQVDVGAEILIAWSDSEAMAKVFECDVLSHPRVDPERTNAVGRYDAYLGVEDFYFAYRDAAGRIDVFRRKTGFKTVLAASLGYLDAAGRSGAFLAKHTEADWFGGELEAQASKLSAQRKALRNVAGQMLERVSADGGRPSLIAAGIAIQLAAEGSDLTVGNQSLLDWASRELKRTQLKTKELLEKYKSAPEADRVLIKQHVLETGLPGDPALKLVWE